MKILGATGNGHIVQIDTNELEMLTGFYYTSKAHTFEIGGEIKVSALFHQLRTLNLQADEIKKMSHALKTAAGMLEKIKPVFHAKDKE